MVGITAINSATPSVQAMVARSRLEQARSEADQAEARARQLRAQADEQDRIGAQAFQRVRTLQGAESSSAPAAAPASDTAAPPPASDQPKTAGQPGATYTETLHTVLDVARPLTGLAMTLPAQHNMVVNSLFQSANRLWTLGPGATRTIGAYVGRGTGASATPGGVLNTVA